MTESDKFPPEARAAVISVGTAIVAGGATWFMAKMTDASGKTLAWGAWPPVDWEVIKKSVDEGLKNAAVDLAVSEVMKIK